MKLTRNQLIWSYVLVIGIIFYACLTYVSIGGGLFRGDTLENSDKSLINSTPENYIPQKVTPLKVRAFHQVDFHALKNLDREILRNAFYGNFKNGEVNALDGKFRVVGSAQIDRPFDGVILRLEPAQAPFIGLEGAFRRQWEIFWYIPIKGNANGELRQAIADAVSSEVQFDADDCMAIIDVSPANLRRVGIVHVFSPRMTVLSLQNKSYKLDLLDPAAAEEAVPATQPAVHIQQETNLSDISGLKLWLKADEGVTADADGKVSRWDDQSDHGNHASQSNSYKQPTLMNNVIKGRSVIRFCGNYLTIPDSANLRPNHYTLFGVVKENSLATYQTFLSKPWRNGSWNDPYVTFDMCTLGSGDSNYLRSAVTTAEGGLVRAENSNTYALGSFHVVEWKFDGTNQYLYSDSNLVGTTRSPGHLKYPDETVNFTIGSRSDTSPGEFLNADVAEILLYDASLSDADRNKVEQYLGDKYGVGHSGVTSPQVPDTVVISPTPPMIHIHSGSKLKNLSGLKIWFKADEGVTADENGFVSKWADQTGRFTVQQSNSPQQPTYVKNALNGHPVLHWNGGQFLYSPILVQGLNADMTIISVGSIQPSSDEEDSIFLGVENDRAYTGLCRILGYGWGASHQMMDTAWIDVEGAVAPSPGTVVVEAWTLDAARKNVVFYRNGLQTTTKGISGLGNLSRGISVGAAGASLQHAWHGDIAEILVYDHQLSSEEVSQVTRYLANKYDVPDVASDETSVPQTRPTIHIHPGKDWMDISGMKLWLKADEGVTVDENGLVNRWNDQSDHGNNARQSTSYNQPTFLKNAIGGKPAIRFRGNYLTIPDSLNLRPNRYTIFGVVKENSTATYQTLLSREYRKSSMWYDPYVTFMACTFGANQSNYLRGAVTTERHGVVRAENPNTYDITLWHLFAWKFDGINQYMYSDSNLVGTTSSVGDLDYSGGTVNFTIGSMSDSAPGEFLFGDVAEILLYDVALSDADRNRVEQYLGDKYDIGHSNASLPKNSDTPEKIFRHK